MHVKVLTRQASCDILPPVTQTGETHERIHSKIMSSVLATAKGRQNAFCSHMKGVVSLVSRHKNSKSKDFVASFNKIPAFSILPHPEAMYQLLLLKLITKSFD